MRVEQRDGYRVIVGGPVPPQADAITLGKTIIVRDAASDSDGLMRHELVHVRQFRELGPIGFLRRYVGSYLAFRLSGFNHMAAYRRIPLEVEASWLSRTHSRERLEPNAAALQRRLAPQRPSGTSRPRQAPKGTWNRSGKPTEQVEPSN